MNLNSTNESKLSFDYDKLCVDYISLNLNNHTKEKVLNYLSTIGFNSQIKQYDISKAAEFFIHRPKNEYLVIVVENVKNWDGYILQIPGKSADYFYQLLKKYLVEWEIFQEFKISRFDLCFYRSPVTNDNESVLEFLHSCQKQVLTNKITKSASIFHNTDGIMLKIFSRRSYNHIRIYQKNSMTSLKFELEIRKTAIHKYQGLLRSNNFQSFEEALTNHFLSQYENVIQLQSCYSDWLVAKLRLKTNSKAKLLLIESNYINSHFLEINSFQESDFQTKNYFIYFLKLLAYTRNSKFENKKLSSTYRKISFFVKDFWQFVNPEADFQNYYQYKKIIVFLEFIQKNYFIKSFSDNDFRSIAAIPELFLFKLNKKLVCTVWMNDQLFEYTYPFYIPNLFYDQQKKHEFEIRFFVLQRFSTPGIEKKIDVEAFIQQYPAVLSPNKKVAIKKYFIETIELLKVEKIIQENYKIKFYDNFMCVKKLTTRNISKVVLIYEIV